MRNQESLSLSFLGKAILVALSALVVGNLLSFWVLYADTFTPLSLPYRENFDQLLHLRYRQFGGFWHIRDGALQQDDTNGTDLLAVIPMTLSAAQPYHFESTMKINNGPNGGGLMFNLQHADNRQQSHLVRFGSDSGKNYLVFGYFDENLNFVAQGTATPPDLSQSVQLGVNVHEENYDVLVNGQPVQVAIPLQYKGGRVALTTWFSAVGFDNLALYAIDPQLPSASEVASNNEQPAENEKAGNDPSVTVAQSESKPEPTPKPESIVNPTINDSGGVLSDTKIIKNSVEIDKPAIGTILTQTLDTGNQGIWIPFSGQWSFEQGKLLQTQPDGFDHGITNDKPLRSFEISVRLRHRQGVGGGILFHLPTQTSEKGGHLVRFFEDNVVAWGYFDADGVFTGQGYTAIASPGNAPQILKVIATSETYAIVLNDQVIVDGVKLVSQEGYVGLTASNSVVEFDQVNIVAGGN